MKRSIIIIFFSFFFHGILFSQTQNLIKGIVTSAINGLPLSNCSVFINSTSKGTITNTHGEFILHNLPEGKYELIVSSIGYQTYSFEYDSKQLPLELKISLKQKSTELSEVTVEPTLKNGWRDWGKTFVENFIGTTENASSCSIKNIKVLRFWFSKKKNRLTVRADEPLIIENKALGYIIKYQLEDFYIDFITNITFYAGYPFFQEIDTSSRKIHHWKEERKNVFFGSLKHFIECLYDNKIVAQGFLIVRTKKILDTEKQRVKNIYSQLMPAADTFAVVNGQMVRINKNVVLPADSIAYYSNVLKREDYHEQYFSLTADSLVFSDSSAAKFIFFNDRLKVLYKNSAQTEYAQSEIYLTTPSSVQIAGNGMYYPAKEILVSGYWGRFEKIAKTLPLDYSPDEK